MTDPVPDDSQLTRRRLIQVAGVATAALYLGELTPPASAAGVPSHLTRSAYAGLTGTPFAATTDGGLATTLRLVKVADLARAGTEADFKGRDDAFALLFSGPAGGGLDSGIHELRHPSLGTFGVFISPVDDRTGGDQRYEVVVDRSVRLATAIEDAPRPPAAAAAAPAAAAATGHPAAKAPAAMKPKQPQKPAPLVESAKLTRRAGKLTVDVRVAPGRGVVSVRGELVRDDRQHARAARMLKGRTDIRLDLRKVRKTPPGRYTLRVTVTDGAGRKTASRHRVTVR